MIELLKKIWHFYTIGIYDLDMTTQSFIILATIPAILIIFLIALYLINIPIRIITYPLRKRARKKKEAEKAALQEAFKQEVLKFEEGKLELSPEEFFELRLKSTGKEAIKEYAENYDCTGIYILHNKDIDQYYVGQSENVLKRVNQHFTGSGGNGDVYADYKNGNEWTIRIVPLWSSGFKRLNALEMYGIKLYNAYEKGYNKTRGNK